MKKLIIFSLFLAVVMTACYDDYTTDYAYTAAYFAYQYPARTIVLDDKMENIEIEVGATIGGKYSYAGVNTTVYFEIADTFVTNNPAFVDQGIKVMPASWYTLSNNSEINIVDSNSGAIKVTIDKDSLTKYPEAASNTYVIPFLITDATTDTVLADKSFSLVAVKYKNQFDGRYYVKGVDNTLNPDGSVASSLAYSNPALVLNKYIFLNTTSKEGLRVPRIGSNQNNSEFVYDMTVRASDGSALLSGNASSTVKELVGTSTYNFATKTFISKYNYKLDGFEHSVVDTLIYSNTEINLESWN